MLSDSVPRVAVKLGNGTAATVPDWLAAAYVREIRKLTTVRTIVLGSEFVGFPELLSFSLYGNQQYWRILLMYNGITDWFSGMRTGMILKVPDLMDIESLYTAQQNSKIGQKVML